MAWLLIFFEIMVLSASRANITRFAVPRGFYNALAIGLLLLLLIFSALSRRTPVDRWWQKWENGFAAAISVPWKNVLLKLLLVVLLGMVLLPALELMFAEPVRCHGSDMLPLIRQSGEMIVSGQSPFAKSYCPWGIPLIYLPAQVLVYLPAVALHLDLRILSFVYFVLFLLVVYHVRSSTGRPLSAILCMVILAGSGMLHFFLSFVQLFPYLFLLALLFAATLNRRVALAAFLAGMLLVFRQTFWFVFPLFVILCVRHKIKIRKNDWLSFAAGIFLGSLPYVLFIGSFLRAWPRLVSHFSHLTSSDLFLKNSLGLAWYFPQSRWLLAVLMLLVLAVLYLLAWRTLSDANLWLFFSLTYFSVVVFTSYNRAEEYYLLPLLAAAAFMGHERFPAPDRSILPARRALIFLVLSLGIALSAPNAHSRRKGIYGDDYWQAAVLHQGRRGEGVLDLNWQVNLRQRLALPTALRLVVDSPGFAETPTAYSFSVDMNENNIHRSTVRGRMYKVEIATDEFRSKLLLGANLLEISVQPETPFRVKIVPLFR
jgi:hypothetical protein